MHHLPTILTVLLVFVSLMSFGLLLATLAWPRWSVSERLCVAPFCSIAVTILVLKALHRFGFWLPRAPRTWVLAGMAAIAIGSIAIMIVRGRRTRAFAHQSDDSPRLAAG